MKKLTLLASLLICGSTVFAQSLDFIYNQVPVNEGETITTSEMDETDMILAPIVVKNQGATDVTATLSVTVMELNGEGVIGYCGWGSSNCAPLSVNTPFARTTTVAVGSEIDPKIEAMAFESSSAKTKLELTYGATTKTMYIQFVGSKSSISSSTMAGKNVFVNSEGGIADLQYSFDTDGARVLNIYNVTGNLIASKTVSGSEGTASFSLNKGIYLYSVVEGGKVITSSKFSVN